MPCFAVCQCTGVESVANNLSILLFRQDLQLLLMRFKLEYDRQFWLRSSVAAAYSVIGLKKLDRIVNRDIRRPIVRPIVATDWTINRGAQRTSKFGRTTSRKVVQPVGKKVLRSRTTERDVVRRVAPPTFRWHDQSCDCVSSTTGGAILNRRLQVLNMTIDHAATAFALDSILWVIAQL